MTLRKAKVLFCVAAISIAILMIAAGDIARWIGAVLLLIGVLPLFRLITRHSAREALSTYQSVRHRADHHIQAKDRGEGDPFEMIPPVDQRERGA